MNYNLANREEVEAARAYLTKLTAKEARVSIKQIRQGRTLNQNSYLHLLLGAFGLHFGYTLEEAKQIYKDINSEVYLYTKNRIRFTRSSAELDTKEMTRTIDRFREWSNEQGCYLPPATSTEELLSIQNQIETSGYL